MRSGALNGKLDFFKAMKTETLESVKTDASPSTVTASGDAVVTMAPPATKIPTDVSVDIAVRHDLIFDGVLEVAREIRADLIITTTHGYTGVKHLVLGSTAENIVRRAPCPVFVVRETEQVFV